MPNFDFLMEPQEDLFGERNVGDFPAGFAGTRAISKLDTATPWGGPDPATLTPGTPEYEAAFERRRLWDERRRTEQEAARSPVPRLETTFRSAGLGDKALGLLRSMYRATWKVGMQPDRDELDSSTFYGFLATQYPGGRQLLEELVGVYAQEPLAVQGGGAQGQPKPGQTIPEMDYLGDLRQERGRSERSYFDALRRMNTYPELKTFWGAALFFLTSLLLGPKNAAMIFMRKHDDGTLAEELRYYRDRVRGAEQQEQYAVRAAERARTEEGRRRQREVQQATALRSRAFSAWQQQQRLDLQKTAYLDRLDRLTKLEDARLLSENRRAEAAALRRADELLRDRIRINLETLKLVPFGKVSPEAEAKANAFFRDTDALLKTREAAIRGQ